MTNNRTNLVEIKKGEIGKGLLIEPDGYITLREGENKKLFEDFNSNMGDFKIPYPFKVHAIFQKYGIQNANGRIYPEHLLRREVERYQSKINERNAYGECYLPDTLILTQTGWKELKDTKVGENILTLNTNTGNIEIKPILKLIKKDFKGNMIRIKGRNIDDLVTPEHGYPIYNRYNNFNDFFTAKQILEKDINDQNHSFIPKQGIWEGVNTDKMIIKSLTNEEIKNIRIKSLIDKYSNDLIIPIDTWVKFMGIYLSEGSIAKKGYAINISQKKEDVCIEIEKMLDEWGINYTINTSKSLCKTFVISDMRLYKYLSQFGNCYNKYIPFEIKNLSKELLTIFYDWFVMGDGRIKKIKGRKITSDVFSASKQLALDLNEIQLKIGYSGDFSVDELRSDRILKSENSKPLYFSYKSLTKGIYLDERFINVSEEYYNGEVMCVEVENHTWYCMSNNKTHWTKNCNHPQETTIDLGRIALNIIELHWEGATLVGELEIPITEGFRKYGICSTYADQCAQLLFRGLKIGVSSRGIGSVENKYGKHIVGDDFELICWDFVSDPSTPGAWVSPEKDALQQYIENKENKKPLLSEKIKELDII